MVTTDGPVTPMATTTDEPVTPMATNTDEPVTPMATNTDGPVTPMATPTDEPVTPMATNTDGPVTPMATPTDGPVPPMATPNGPLNLEFKEALDHNRTIEVKKNGKGKLKVVGCHNLDCMLQGVTKGLVLEGIDRLPGDGLPRGVYEVRLSCRKDQPAPNRRPSVHENCPRHHPKSSKKPSHQNKKHSGRARDNSPDSPMCTESIEFKWQSFDKLKEESDEKSKKKKKKESRKGATGKMSRQAGAMVDGIKLMFSPTMKTVFNPAIWDDKKLTEKCEEAFQYYLNGKAHDTVTEFENIVKWQGQFEFEGANYWFEGVFQKEGSVMKTFYFHPRKE